MWLLASAEADLAADMVKGLEAEITWTNAFGRLGLRSYRLCSDYRCCDVRSVAVSVVGKLLQQMETLPTAKCWETSGDGGLQ